MSYRHKVLGLFQFLKENPSFLKMSMTGEAVIRGERIISSSVYCLLDFLFHNRRKVLRTPLGTEELMEALATTNFFYSKYCKSKTQICLENTKSIRGS